MTTETALTRTNGTDMQRRETGSVLDAYSPEQVQILKTQIAPGASDTELLYFLHVARLRDLDPFAKQIYAIRRKSWNAEKRQEEWRMTIQTGIDGFRAIADRTGYYAPGDESWDLDEHGRPKSATVSVEKLVAGSWRRYSATAHLEEYMPTKQDGSPMGLWAKMPKVMLAKCAEAKALRKGWPEQLSGLYTGDEMEQADAASPPAKPAAAPSRAEALKEKLRAEQPETPAEVVPAQEPTQEAPADPGAAAFEAEIKSVGEEIRTKLGREKAAWEWGHTMGRVPRSGKDLETRRQEYLRKAYDLRDRLCSTEPGANG